MNQQPEDRDENRLDKLIKVMRRRLPLFLFLLQGLAAVFCVVVLITVYTKPGFDFLVFIRIRWKGTGSHHYEKTMSSIV